MRCSRIKTLEIPGNVQTIGKTAFAKCTGLEELEIEEGVQTVEEAAFAECSSLNAMILPEVCQQFCNKFCDRLQSSQKNLLQRNQRTVDCSELKQ